MRNFYRTALFFILVVALSLLISNCATIFKGSKDGVSFSSDPGGAKVYVNGILLGTTPVQLELISKNTYTIEFKKEGYDTRTVLLNNSVGGGWVVLDVIFGLLPVIVDAATGNWYHLDQDHVNGILEKQQ